MASPEQLEAIFRANHELMAQLQQQQQQAMQGLLSAFMNELQKGPKYNVLDDRRFRDIGCFGGTEDQWREWALKFRAAVKEGDPRVAEAMTWAETEDEEITVDEVKDHLGETTGEMMNTALYNRMVKALSGPALQIHQGVVGENGLEVWRVLSRRYNPMTPMRGLQLMLKVMVPGKIGKGEDVLTKINKWENWVNQLQRDYGEAVSDRMKIGILIHMFPPDLQDLILQHADRLKEYRLVKEKAVGLIDARSRLRDPHAMDVDQLWKADEWEDGHEEYEIAQMARDMRCFRCGGYGHRANDCGTPKGKGKGKDGKGQKGKGKGPGEGEKGKGKGGARPACSHCGKIGHGPNNCWTLHPEQAPWKQAHAVDFDAGENAQGEMGFDVGCIEVMGCTRRGRELRVEEYPPGLSLSSSFAALEAEGNEVEEHVVSLGALEIEYPIREVGALGETGKRARQEGLKPAGRGKITIDSGAAESVLPRGFVPGEPLVEGEGKRNGVKYVAANGGRMENMGEKRVRFRRSGNESVNAITVQVTDVGKPHRIREPHAGQGQHRCVHAPGRGLLRNQRCHGRAHPGEGGEGHLRAGCGVPRARRR